MHGGSCRHTVHRNGSITSSHPLWGAAMSHPDGRAVMPLLPEPLVQPDGPANHEGERPATTRFMAPLRQDPPPLTCLIPEDRRRAHAPPSETLHDGGSHAILGVKAGAQASWFTQVQAAEAAGGVTS